MVRRADQSPPARNAKAAPNGIGGGAGKGDEAIAREEDAKPEEKLALGQTRREAARGKAAPSAKAAAPPPPSGASVPPPKSDAPPPPTVRTGPISAPGAQVQTGPTAGQTVNPSDNLPTGPTQTYRAPASANLQQSQNRGTGTQARQQTFDDAPAEGCVTLSICIQGPPGTSNALNNLNPANAAPVFGPQLPPTTQNARPVQNAAPPGQTANPGILSPAGRTTAPATSNPAAGARRD